MINNIPNKITIIRICLLPLVIFFYLAEFMAPWGKLVAFILFVIACLTDALDGFIARKYNLVTDFGKFLDPIADKLMATTGLLLLIANHTIPVILSVVFMFIMILRDYIVTGLRQVGQLRGKIISADKVAKIKANALYFTLILGMFIAFLKEVDTITSDFINTANIILYVCVCITIILIAISGLNYLFKNISVFAPNTPHIEEIKEDDEKLG